MKHKTLFNASFIVPLILALILTSAPYAFAETTDGWVTKASMLSPRYLFQTEIIDGNIYAIGGRDQNKKSISEVEEYDPASDTWAAKKSMLTPRDLFQTQVIDGKIYAIGGYDLSTQGYLSSVEEYDPASDTWTAKKSMFTPRCEFQTQVINGKIYAIGGSYGTTHTPSVEVYDPASDTWEKKASMATGRSSFQSEVIGGKIYVIGGRLSNGFISSVEEYDPQTDHWTTKASMATNRSSFQTEVYNGKIYAVGGYCDTNQCKVTEEYDPTTDIWIKKAPMSTERHSFQTKIMGGKMIAFGGSNTTIEAYDFSTNTWEPRASIPVSTYGFNIEMINGKIYAIGGTDGHSSLSSVEEYTAAEPTQKNPTLTVTASSNKVKVGQQFTTAIAIHNGTNICAEDIKVKYDADLFTYAGAEAQTGLKIYKEDASASGTVRFICACVGKENAATGDKGLITLKFTAKKQGVGKVDIIRGRIADNSTLEMDVSDENCGEDTITVEGYADVNKNGEFTLLDLGIDGWYNGMNAADTDTTNFNADVVADGKIDDNDLAEITKGILANSNYQPNT